MTIDLIKQQALDTDPEPIQQINLTGNLRRAEGATVLFIIEEAKETKKLFQIFNKELESIVNLF